MAFDRQQPVTAVAIGDIESIIFDPNPDPESAESITPGAGGRVQSATAVIQVIMSDGTARRKRVDIPTHFSTTVVNQLKAFGKQVRDKANAEILGG